MWKLKTHVCFQQIPRSGFITGGNFRLNFATKLIADIIPSYLTEMLLIAYEDDVVNSFKILPERSRKLGLYNFSWVTQRVKISKQS